MECLPLRHSWHLADMASGPTGPNVHCVAGYYIANWSEGKFHHLVRREQHWLSGEQDLPYGLRKASWSVPVSSLCLCTSSPPTISPIFPHLLQLCNWQGPRKSARLSVFFISSIRTPLPSFYHAVNEDFTAEQVEDMLDNPHTQLVSDEVGVVQNTYRYR